MTPCLALALLLATALPAAAPGDDGVVEKTCYGNEAESCRVYGGLYTGPFEVPSGRTVSATAIRVGYAQSGTVEFAVP